MQDFSGSRKSLLAHDVQEVSLSLHSEQLEEHALQIPLEANFPFGQVVTQLLLSRENGVLQERHWLEKAPEQVLQEFAQAWQVLDESLKAPIGHVL